MTAKTVTHTISIIRSRGQLTIPDSIRALRSWANPDSVVTITSNQPDEIVIRPHKKYDWDKIWKGIKKARAIKGKNAVSAFEIITRDRQSH